MTAKVANSAVDARTAHAMRGVGAKINRAVTRPHGHYSHDALMLGTIAAIHGWTIDGLPPSVDIHPNGAQNMGTVETLMKSVQYLESYWPVIGDVVVMITQPVGKSRSLRYVIGAVDGSASPYPRPLGHLDSVGRWVQGPGSIWGGTGAPTITLADPSASPPVQGAVNGDWYLQMDEPIAWVMLGGVWVPVTNLAPAISISATSFELVLGDIGGVLEFTASSAVTVTVPANASVPFPVGTVVRLIQAGTGQVSVSGAAGVTIETPGTSATAAQWSEVTLVQVAADSWVLGGDLTKAGRNLTANYTVTPGDMGSLLVMNSTVVDTSILLADTYYPIGGYVDVCQLGTGQVTFASSTGVTMLIPSGHGSATRVQYSIIRATQIAANEWVLSGDLD